MSRWVSEVTDFLVEQKRDGAEFGDAWTAATFAYPPRLHELGVRAVRESLLDQQSAVALEWFRGVCQAAYCDAPAADGSPSRLRGLSAALESVPSDERLVARVPGHGRAVAA